jgi:predicted DNA-binding transcriptional regulator AlpA
MAMPEAKQHAKEREIPDALRNFDSLPDSAYVRMPVMTGRYGVVPMTIYRWSKTGRLPKPIKLGPKTTAWNVGQVRAADRAAAEHAG